MAAAVALAAGVSAFAGTIHGTVTNQTSGKLSAGDKVTLLSLSSALEELQHTITDAKGQFNLTTPSEAPYLVRVEHQKGAYFKNVPPGTTQIEVTVYDVAPKVAGVSTEADVLRVEPDTAGSGQLKITENYFVKNVSSPPRTESSEHTYEVVLPPDATLDGAATVGPSNVPTAATPDPVPPKGHYAFSFPIRPNEGENGTRFQLTYHVPYSGSYKFTPHLMQDTDNVAVLLPKGMTFTPGPGTSFQPVPDDVTGQTFLMRGARPGQPLEFSVSGTGAFPREAQNGPAGSPAGAQAGSQAGTQANNDAAQGGPNGAPGGGLGNPIDTPDPLSKYKWWILGGLGIVLVVAAAFLLRKPSGSPIVLDAAGNVTTGTVASATAPVSYAAPTAYASPTAPADKSKLLLEALKEELFAIESEKIAGKLTPQEYIEQKAALETVLRRALGRQA